MERAHIFITGDVIGVGFRSWTVREAQKLGLTGWVKNIFEPKQGVEAVFEGKIENIEKMIELCKIGPEISWVDKVRIDLDKPTDKYEEFLIL